MTGTVQPYCHGMGCPLKEKCGRYKIGIDFKKEIHLAYAPFNPKEMDCSHYVGSKEDLIAYRVNQFRDAN